MCHLYIGPKENGREGDHWERIVKNPEMRVALWHEAIPGPDVD